MMRPHSPLLFDEPPSSSFQKKSEKLAQLSVLLACLSQKILGQKINQKKGTQGQILSVQSHSQKYQRENWTQGKAKESLIRTPEVESQSFARKPIKRILVWLRYSMDWNFPSFNNINYSSSESFTALIFSAMLLKLRSMASTNIAQKNLTF